MKPCKVALLIVMSVFLFLSCDMGMFEGNLFRKMEIYLNPVPNVSKASAGEIMKAAEDDRFLKGLSSEESEVVASKMSTVYENTDNAPEKRARAAWLGAKVLMDAYGGRKLFETANHVLGTYYALWTCYDFAYSGDELDKIRENTEEVMEAYVRALLDSLFHAGDEEAGIRYVADLLAHYQTAAEVYYVYGAILGEMDLPSQKPLQRWDKSPVDTAVRALACRMVDIYVECNGGGFAGQDALARALYKFDYDSIESAESDDDITGILEGFGGAPEDDLILNIINPVIDMASVDL